MSTAVVAVARLVVAAQAARNRSPAQRRSGRPTGHSSVFFPTTSSSAWTSPAVNQTVMFHYSNAGRGYVGRRRYPPRFREPRPPLFRIAAESGGTFCRDTIRDASRAGPLATALPPGLAVISSYVSGSVETLAFILVSSKSGLETSSWRRLSGRQCRDRTPAVRS